MRKPLLPLETALAQLLASLEGTRLETEWVSTMLADGRVLAQVVSSELQVPPQDNSSMDGYAVRLADVGACNGILPVSQRIPAGMSPQALLAGTAARIFTGAPIPFGADAVVMQEDCVELSAVNQQDTERVQVNQMPSIGQWIRRSGEDVSKGEVVLAAGQRLGPAELGMAASIGFAKLCVVRRPRVALFSTGDELVMPGDIEPRAMPASAIYNSNRFFLNSLLRRLGCDVTDFGIIPDQREATIAALRIASESNDLVLTSGGVSVGEEDHVKPAVQSLGSLDLWQIAIKPGKPFAHGRIGACHFIGLPGNPVSSFVTFLVLVRPFLQRLQGLHQSALPVTLMRADFDWLRPDKRQEFLRVRRNTQGGLDLFPNQSSGVLSSVVWGDGLVDNPAGQSIRHGDQVGFVAFNDLLG